MARLTWVLTVGGLTREPGDLVVGVAAGDQREDFALAPGERVQPPGLVRSGRGRCSRKELGDQASGHDRGEQRLARRDDTDRGEELVRFGALAEEPGAPARSDSNTYSSTVEGGQDDDAYMGESGSAR